MKHLSLFDIGPTFSKSVSDEVSGEVVHQALLAGGLSLKSGPRVRGLSSEELELRVIMSVCETDKMMPSSYAVVFPDGQSVLTNELDEVLLLSETPAVVLPLAGLGETIRNATGEPLVTVVV